MKVHILKSVELGWMAQLDNAKQFELRKLDRDYACGDALVLCLYDEEHETYPARAPLVRIITYMTNWPVAVQHGYVALGTREPTAQEMREVVGKLVRTG